MFLLEAVKSSLELYNELLSMMNNNGYTNSFI